MRHFPKVRALGTVAVLLFAAPLGAQSRPASASSAATTEVHRAVLDYVEGFYEGDSAKLVRSVRPEVHKFGFFVPRGPRPS